MIEFKGKCKGVKLAKRGSNDEHITVAIMTEDDENWFTADSSMSSYWIDELIEQLQKARDFIKTQEPDLDKDGRQWGYKFKKD